MRVSLPLSVAACVLFASCAGNRTAESPGVEPPKGEKVAVSRPYDEGCKLKTEPAQVKPGQSFTLSWNTDSPDAALFVHHQPGVKVPSAGTRTFFYNEPGEYEFGLGLLGEKGGFMPSCSAKVVVTAGPKGRSKLALLRQQPQKDGQFSLRLSVYSDPKEGCKGSHTLGFGDGQFQDLPDLKGCKAEWSGTQQLVSGKVTATLYRGTVSDAASGKAKVLAELPISVAIPAVEKKP